MSPEAFDPRDPLREGARAARARKLRSLAIALGLVALAALTFIVSILRMSASHAPAL